MLLYLMMKMRGKQAPFHARQDGASPSTCFLLQKRFSKKVVMQYDTILAIRSLSERYFPILSPCGRSKRFIFFVVTGFFSFF